jgi:hypothetical protein
MSKSAKARRLPEPLFSGAVLRLVYGDRGDKPNGSSLRWSGLYVRLSYPSNAFCNFLTVQRQTRRSP